MTKPEVILWSVLQRKQQLGYRFLRQYSIGCFVVDFYCPKLKLAIEIDGISHNSNKAKQYDKEREEGIKIKEIKFLRFTNEQVLNNLNAVIKSVRIKIVGVESQINHSGFKPPVPINRFSPLSN